MGEERELAKCWKEVNQKKVGEFMLQSSADWIQWKRNPPLASHMGGVWERQIRSARNILSSLMKTHGASLDEESLNTLFVEVKGIVNSRPLVVETINDVNSQAPLSPSHILNMKLKLVMPPAGMFGTPDLYCRKRWRRVQHISSKFWSRWRKEFLATLQDRQKWKAPLRNFLIGDIVILKEDTQHNDWRLAMVIKVYKDDKGYGQTVKLYFRCSDPTKLMNRVLVLPIDKIVLLLDSDEEVRSLTEELSKHSVVSRR